MDNSWDDEWTLRNWETCMQLARDKRRDGRPDDAAYFLTEAGKFRRAIRAQRLTEAQRGR